jgi:hypothetical protein
MSVAFTLRFSRLKRKEETAICCSSESGQNCIENHVYNLYVNKKLTRIR